MCPAPEPMICATGGETEAGIHGACSTVPWVLSYPGTCGCGCMDASFFQPFWVFKGKKTPSQCILKVCPAMECCPCACSTLQHRVRPPVPSV